ncbi:collagen alpha-1(XIV) chain [Elysia marginata]|uniref:Collagen alpha-1(XIV) chain n=1 Tax=Elysia marginata TaxID=1093978 RepID=A0AAV4FKX5_9GAST|nr:collagen alpha-1(XIV) chain [Elysia marginata]
MFGDRVYTEDVIKFDSYNNKKDVQDAILALPWKKGNRTETGMGINYAVQNLMSEKRPLAAHIGIVITDGRSQNPQRTASAAQTARDANLLMYAVGVGKFVNLNDLLMYAVGVGKSVNLNDLLMYAVGVGKFVNLNDLLMDAVGVGMFVNLNDLLMDAVGVGNFVNLNDLLMYAVGVGDVHDRLSAEELNNIAGDPERVLLADSYRALNTIKALLTEKACAGIDKIITDQRQAFVSL